MKVTNKERMQLESNLVAWKQRTEHLTDETLYSDIKDQQNSAGSILYCWIVCIRERKPLNMPSKREKGILSAKERRKLDSRFFSWRKELEKRGKWQKTRVHFEKGAFRPLLDFIREWRNAEIHFKLILRKGEGVKSSEKETDNKRAKWHTCPVCEGAVRMSVKWMHTTGGLRHTRREIQNSSCSKLSLYQFRCRLSFSLFLECPKRFQLSSHAGCCLCVFVDGSARVLFRLKGRHCTNLRRMGRCDWRRREQHCSKHQRRSRQFLSKVLHWKCKFLFLYGKHERQRDGEADRQAIIKHRTVGERFGIRVSNRLHYSLPVGQSPRKSPKGSKIGHLFRLPRLDVSYPSWLDPDVVFDRGTRRLLFNREEEEEKESPWERVTGSPLGPVVAVQFALLSLLNCFSSSSSCAFD